MSKTPEKQQDANGVKFSGTAKTQTLTMADNDAVKRLFRTDSNDMANGLLYHCIKVLKDDEITDKIPGNDERQFMVAAVAEIEPRDGIERMLAVQMAATHVAMIRTGRRLAGATMLPQFDAHERAYNKLARTFTAQMEALRKHRNGGKQTVTVQHVNVSDGGQAIVGNVEAGGRGNGRK